MITSSSGLSAEAVLRIGSITLHETAAYAAILGVAVVVLGFVSRYAAKRTEREAWRALRRLLGRHH